VDDATGDIVPKLNRNEGIQAVFSFWKEYLIKQGKPKAIYLDKFSTYKNKTLQDRMVKEMRLAKINNTKKANEFIQKEFIAKFNRKFSVKPRAKQDLHQKLTN